MVVNKMTILLSGCAKIILRNYQNVGTPCLKTFDGVGNKIDLRHLKTQLRREVFDFQLKNPKQFPSKKRRKKTGS
jgi:hypothetical protein